MEPKHQATAVVTVTLRIKVDGTWGDDCSVKQVHQQAKRSAINMIERALYENKVARGRFTLVGTPNVSAILTERT